MEYYSGITKNEIMPFLATGMDLEIIALRKVSKIRKDKYMGYCLHEESKKKWYKQTYLQKRNRVTKVENKLKVTIREKYGGGDKLGD